MFGEKYKKDMEKVKAPAASAESLILLAEKQAKRKRRNVMRIIAAAAACLIVLTGALTAYPMLNGTENLSHLFVEGGTLSKLFADWLGKEPEKSPITYSELCTVISTKMNEQKKDGLFGSGIWCGDEEDAVLEETPEIAPEGGDSIENENTGDFSDTNNQVSGVQEADVIKTDGKFIYTVKGDKLSVFSANNGDITLCSVTITEKECRDMILYGNRVLLISRNINDVSYTSTDENTVTKIYVYEISPEGKAQKVDEFTQSGYYISSRMIDGRLILITNHLPYYGDYSSLRDESYIITSETIYDALPVINESVIAPECVVVPDEFFSTNFLVVSAFDAATGESSSISMLGAGCDVYSDTDTLYVYCQTYDKNGSQTIINSFDISGAPCHKATGKVDGYCINQYALDEYQGNLRIATTVKNENAVYVLNEKLEKIGEIGGMGKNERIKSVRYMGDIAYVVTFRQTDPLYAIDLKDPTNPTILSELKIPGFSTYMQGYGSGKMFGFGYNADEENGWTKGLKLSMFDTTVLTDVKEEATLLLDENTYFSDDVLKAVSVQYQKRIIMFPYMKCVPDGEGRYKDMRVFGLYTYGENGFELLGENILEYDYNTAGTRGIYIGDYIYVTDIYYDGAATVRSFTIDDLTLIDICTNEK